MFDSLQNIFLLDIPEKSQRGKKKIARQMQSVLLNQQMQKADTHLLKGISDENKHNITLFHYENALLRLPYPPL